MKRTIQSERVGMEGIEGIGSALSIGDGNTPTHRSLGENIPSHPLIPTQYKPALPEIVLDSDNRLARRPARPTRGAITLPALRPPDGHYSLPMAVDGELLPRSKRVKRGGRQKGTPNRVTTDIRAALRDLAESNTVQVQNWLDRVAEDDPAEAVRLWLALLRFVTPTLQAAAIADITPKRPREQLAELSERELLAIVRGATVPALPNPDDEELLR